MNNENEQLEGLERHFQDILDNPAFRWMMRSWDDRSLVNRADSMQEKAERYIAESAVKEFIREIRKHAEGVIDPVALISEAMLEDENEVIDEDEDIFETTR